MADVKVIIQAPRGELKWVEMPDDVPLRELLPEIVTKLEGSVTGPDGQPMNFRLDSKAVGRPLRENETLASASVPEGSLLILSLVVSAGSPAAGEGGLPPPGVPPTKKRRRSRRRRQPQSSGQRLFWFLSVLVIIGLIAILSVLYMIPERDSSLAQVVEIFSSVVAGFMLSILIAGRMGSTELKRVVVQIADQVDYQGQMMLKIADDTWSMRGRAEGYPPNGPVIYREGVEGLRQRLIDLAGGNQLVRKGLGNLIDRNLADLMAASFIHGLRTTLQRESRISRTM